MQNPNSIFLGIQPNVQKARSGRFDILRSVSSQLTPDRRVKVRFFYGFSGQYRQYDLDKMNQMARFTFPGRRTSIEGEASTELV